MKSLDILFIYWLGACVVSLNTSMNEGTGNWIESLNCYLQKHTLKMDN